MVVLPDGKVTICDMIIKEEQFIIGDLKRSTIKEIWNSEKVKQLREIPQKFLWDECINCEHLKRCRTGCFNLSKEIYGDYFAPDPHCPVYL